MAAACCLVSSPSFRCPPETRAPTRDAPTGLAASGGPGGGERGAALHGWRLTLSERQG